LPTDSSKAIEGDQSLPATDRITGQEGTMSDEDVGQNDQQNELERHRSKNRKRPRKSDVEAPAKAAALPPYVKKEKFFIDPEDSCIGGMCFKKFSTLPKRKYSFILGRFISL
jgi:hypothetical protein